MSVAPGPVRITAQHGPWPLHDGRATRAIEARALASGLPLALMESAGQATARLALALAWGSDGVRVFAGPGNNGGDGLVAARLLRAAGLQVQVSLLGDASRLPRDAAQALSQAVAAGVPVGLFDSQSAPVGPNLVVDALLGLGGSRAPRGPLAEAIALINRSAAPVLAVDLPSGLHPDTGALLGDDAVRADSTINLLTIKSGCFTGAGRDHAGQVWFDSLGVDGLAPTALLHDPESEPIRPHASHKGSFGELTVIGGARGMTGAAWLAAHAALAAGAGRVYVSLLDDADPACAAQRIELMTRRHAWRSPPELLATSTVVCGCGGGEDVSTALSPLLTHSARLVLDADALNAIAADSGLATLLRARAARQRATILTPHPLEAARLLGCPVGQVQGDRLRAALALCERYACVTVLKGSGTVIAQPGSLPRINPTGNAALATAGSGDVLAGWTGGLWAQAGTGIGAGVTDALGRLAAAAVWRHGRAADLFAATGARGPLLAADLIAAMARPQSAA